jgi:hypothetical protein
MIREDPCVFNPGGGACREETGNVKYVLKINKKICA